MLTDRTFKPHRLFPAIVVLAFVLLVTGYRFGKALAFADNQADAAGAARDVSPKAT
jgi:hypothetical protein